MLESLPLEIIDSILLPKYQPKYQKNRSFIEKLYLYPYIEKKNNVILELKQLSNDFNLVEDPFWKKYNYYHYSLYKLLTRNDKYPVHPKYLFQFYQMCQINLHN